MQKYVTVQKRRETLEQEFEKALMAKEQTLQMRIHTSQENKRRRQLEDVLVKDGSVEEAGSRARTANGMGRWGSSQYDSRIDFDEDQELEKKLETMQQMLTRAESQKQSKILHTVEKTAMNNEKVKIKNIIKTKRMRELEY